MASSLRQKVLSGIAWTTAGSVGRQMITFGISAALARILGPDAFGLVAIAMLYLAFVQIFINQGFGTAIIQRKDLEPEHLDSAFWVTISGASVLCIATIALAGPLATALGDARVAPVLQWLSALLVLVALGTIPTAVLTRDLAFRTLSLRTLGGVVAGGVVGLGMALFGYGVWSLVAQQLTTALVGTIYLWWAVGWRPAPRISVPHLRELYWVAVNMLGNEGVWFFSRRSDQAIVAFHFGAIGLGPYAIATRLTQLLVELCGAPFQGVALPTLLRLADNPGRLRAVFGRFLELAAFVSFPAFAGLAVIAPEAVALIFGEKWMDAVPIVRVLAVYGATSVVLSFIHPLMLANDRAGLAFATIVVHAVGTAIACFAVVRFGPAAVAGAMTAVLCVFPIAFAGVYRRTMGITLLDLVRPLWRPMVATFAMSTSVWLVEQAVAAYPPIGRLTLSMTTGVATYALACFVLRRQLAVEIGQLALERSRTARAHPQAAHI